MGDKISYQPVNKDEGADVEEDATTGSAPRWTLPKTQHWSKEWARVMTEVVLVILVFLLSLKVMLDDRTPTASGYKGPNDPKKDCTSFALSNLQVETLFFDELTLS